MPKDYLTGWDYILRDKLELESHPDFSNHARNVAVRITEMTTEQLEKVVLIQGVN